MAELVGIDLGTTNTVVASADDGKGGAIAAVNDVDVVQLVAPGETASLRQLPSTLYIPAQGELDAADLRLPWDESHKASGDAAHTNVWPVGQLARVLGAKVPGRVVVSAKSWLSVATVDRRAPLLPWAAADDAMPRVSPLEVQTRLLRHVASSIAHQGRAPEAITLTIPASFDQVARGLTLEAAAAAGLTDVHLLEEPQAAFYALLAKHHKNLKSVLDGVRLVLVVDVGGGTTDLTLLSIDGEKRKGPPKVDRIAVGDHVMLGGDNMDITLARRVEQKLTGAVGTLDAVSFAHLVLSARLAKETLLGDAAPDEFGVTLLSRGKSLLSGSKVSVESKDDVRTLLLDGFLPFVSTTEVVEQRKSALAELGLPYAKDTALPRHISTFLRRHHTAAVDAGARVFGRGDAAIALPDAVLLNGGVFRAGAIRARLADIFARWAGGDDVVRFFDTDDADLDRAVARGAAYAGLVRRGQGVRIGAGSARAYFVGVSSDDGDGGRGRDRALCVAPRGLVEGGTLEVDRTFRLVTGEPVSFTLFSSTYHGAAAGDVVDTAELELMPSLSTVLQPKREVPVRLEASLTAVGTLELALRMTPEALERFQLSFSTRLDGSVDGENAAAPGQIPSAGSVHKRIDDGKNLILGYFGNKSKDVDAKKVKDLRRDLEKLFGLREQWSLGLSRELAGVLLSGAAKRRRSAEHERAFFQNLGYLLRPGVGAPFDDWRIEQLWPLWKEGVQHVAEKPIWSSWFILWRRVAPGLDAPRQLEVWSYLKPWLLSQGTGTKGQGPTPAGTDEMVRLAASLERIPAAEKVLLGDFIAKKLGRGGVLSAWPLGRVGARLPLAGVINDVVSPDVAGRWIDKILELDIKSADGAVFALCQLARMTGDRTLDVDTQRRDALIARLKKASADPRFVEMVQSVVPMSADDEAAAFGEALPAGLRL
jgi:hypothetical protein